MRTHMSDLILHVLPFPSPGPWKQGRTCPPSPPPRWAGVCSLQGAPEANPPAAACVEATRADGGPRRSGGASAAWGAQGGFVCDGSGPLQCSSGQRGSPEGDARPATSRHRGRGHTGVARPPGAWPCASRPRTPASGVSPPCATQAEASRLHSCPARKQASRTSARVRAGASPWRWACVSS